MPRLRRIALLMGQDLSFCRDVIRGIRAYAIRKPGWVFRNGPPDVQLLPLLREWNPDGIIAQLLSAELAQRLQRLGKPVVDTAYWLPKPRVPVVDVDHAAVGRMAADYLLSLGLTQFGYFGPADAAYSELRETAFRQRLAEAGFATDSCYGEYLHRVPTTVSWRASEEQTRRWLRQLPKPVGLFVCNDVLARSLADLCSHLGLHVPDEVALLGVDDDELECLLTKPPLSSIAIPGERIGYEAARLLDQRLTRPRDASPAPLLLPPVRVVTRQSTDTMAVRDALVITALRYIRTHAVEGANVATVVQALGVGRRELERKFRQTLGRSVLQELLRTRLQQAQRLLASTDLPMPAVAKQAGFSSAHRLAIVFGRLCGLSPTAYRRQSQIRDS